MKKEKLLLVRIISFAAVAGNILFLLWILYNGINENFTGTTMEIISYITLMVLLAADQLLETTSYNLNNHENPAFRIDIHYTENRWILPNPNGSGQSIK